MGKGAGAVQRCDDATRVQLRHLLVRYGLALVDVAEQELIPGSHWGAPEAGLIGTQLFARADTPVHSVLHEACHFVCMDESRRAALHTDASGGYDEENGVCYLSVLLSDRIAGFGRARMFEDMDSWGYSFRLGAARKWFECDAQDAWQWLHDHGLIAANGEPTGRVRT